MAKITRKEKYPCKPEMETLTEPEDMRQNRFSTQVTFNNQFGDINEQAADSIIEEELKETDEKEIEGHSDTDTDDNSYDDDFYPRYAIIEHDLDNGIVVRYPEEYKFKVPYVSRPLDQIQMNTHWTTLKGELADSRLITDLYGIYEEGQLATLPFPDNCNDDVRIVFTMKVNRSPHCGYFAYTRENMRWRKKSVKLKDNTAEFKGGACDIIFLISEPITDKIELGPEGKEYVCKEDETIKIIFPRDCVTQKETLYIQVIPQNNDGPFYVDHEPCIIGASKSVHVKHRKGIFKKQMEMQLDLDLFDNSTNPDLTKYNFVGVHTGENLKEMTLHKLAPESYNKKGRWFSVSMKVDDLRSHNIQLGNHKKMSTDTGKLRVLMALGKIFHCHILVFATRNACSYQGKCIRVECVERKQVNETTEKLSDMQHGFEELVNCRSPPIFLEDGDRIRISLRGGIKLPLGFRKDQMIITFLLEGLQKHIVFPVETQIGNRPVHFGYLDFNRVDGHRELIYETFFDADFTFRKMSQGTATAASPTMSLGIGDRSANLTQLTISLSPDAARLYTSSSARGTTEDQQVTIPIVLERVINTLTTSIPPKDWKFVLRAIIGNSGLNSENIISEAECNHKGDVKEAIYQSLRRWAYKTSLTTTEQKFNAIIQGLLHENFDAIANDLKEKYDKL